MYTKWKIFELFICIYKKPDTLQKARQFALRFYWQKARHFTSRNYLWSFWNRHLYIYKKHDTSRFVTFLYAKSQTLQKKQDKFCYFFIYKKPDTLRHAIFMECLGIGVGEGIFINKNNALCVKLVYAKQHAFSITFLSTKRLTLCVTFLSAKNKALCVTFYIQNLSYCILWYVTINVYTIRAIRSINKFEFFIENRSYSKNK